MIILVRKNVIFEYRARANRNSKFEGNNLICKNTKIYNSYIGRGSYIARDSIICNAKIGRFCSIAYNVRIVTGRHPLSPYVSTSPFFYSKQLKKIGLENIKRDNVEEFKYINKEKDIMVYIGNDVWIGSGVIILDGVRIGDGAVIGAGAVVVKNVLPYTIVGGVPAKKIKDRFTKEQKEFLLNFKWWNKDIKWLFENTENFSDIKKFMSKYM